MNKIDMLFQLGAGLEMFDEPVAAATDVVELEVARERLEEAEENLAIATAERLIDQAETILEDTRARIVNAEIIQGSMESLIAVGVSSKAAGLVMNNYQRYMSNAGVTSTVFAQGTESLDDEAAISAMLTAGLEELGEVKKGLFARLGESLKNNFAAVNKWFDTIGDKVGRMQNRVDTLKKKVSESDGGEVTVKSKYLVVKGGKASTDLKADYASFAKLIDGTLGELIKNGTKFITGNSATMLNKLATAKTIADCVGPINALKPPVHPTASVTVKTEKEYTVKRTEVELGGYALFVSEGKETNAQATAESILSVIEQANHYDLSLKQAPFDEKVEKAFTGTISKADAEALLAEASTLLEQIKTAQKTHFKALDNAKEAMATRIREYYHTKPGDVLKFDEMEDDVQKIIDKAIQLPVNMVCSVLAIPRQSVSAALSVTDAVLDVVEKAAKAKPAKSEE